MSYDLNESMSAWGAVSKRWERGWRRLCLFSLGSFVVVWFVVKQGGATDTQLLAAIIATATLMLLVMIGWIGMILGLGLGTLGVIVENSAHVIKGTSTDSVGEDAASII